MDDNNKPKEKDAVSGIETTGHEWDGLKELNNPAPRWWLWIFVLTVIWSAWYWVVYPAWPTLAGWTAGKYGWTQHQELKSSQEEITTLKGKLLERVRTASLEEVRHDPELYEFARAGGAASFKENCAACHGTGAEGRKGYPNLNDDDWLWGGSLEQVYKTIRVGVRSGHPDEHNTQMPSFGRDGVLKPGEMDEVAEYAAHLHEGGTAPQTEASPRGKEIFAANCSACHGKNGEGNPDMGAARLNDEIWLYGGGKEDIYSSVANAHAGVMPTWEGRLPDDTIKELAVYVHSLGGGK
ncbi:MAG: cytochrome-c oxidase, cbb3-type subunit III [Alphaproteobacteria bacterium]|nr:cytochrome-c oxidase, cbb3-type subunit III [Alphaproteobacteria bacterium]